MPNDIKITHIARTGKESGAIALADVELFGVLSLHGLRLVQPSGDKAAFVSPPSWKIAGPRYVDMATWTDPGFSRALLSALIDAFRGAPDADGAPYEITRRFFDSLPMREAAQ
jgi:DNA-binding cell septation regulator SpoVG